MADLTPPPQPSPFGWFFASRKGLLTLFVLIIAVVFAVLVAVQVARGRLTMEAGFGFVSVSLLGWFGIAFKTIDAISKEDVATKSQQAPPAAPGDQP